MTKVTIALDWFANTNHIGMYIARAKGLYQKEGLDVSFVSPHVDGYKRTPASRVQDGSALLALTPSESIVSYNTAPTETHGDKPKLRAVATVLQDDLSAIVTLQSSGIDRPAKLDGKKYASYAARYEGRIIQRMIQGDGGKGDYTETTPSMLDIWGQLLSGEADAAWVFKGCESVEAKMKGVVLNHFTLGDFGVPYGYSPVMVGRADTLDDNAETLRKFLRATQAGYQAVLDNPDEAAQLFVTEATADAPQGLDIVAVQQSLPIVTPHLLHKSRKQWGWMDAERFDAFVDWLWKENLLTTKMQSARLGVTATTTSLDGLRAGDVGERIPRDQVPTDSLFTNAYLA